MQVRIVQTPGGEAPLWVREAWIGLTLPILYNDPVKRRTFGVLTAPKSLFGQTLGILAGRSKRIFGYSVVAKSAVDLLANQNGPAAERWRKNASHLLDGQRTFIFDAESCEETG